MSSKSKLQQNDLSCSQVYVIGFPGIKLAKLGVTSNIKQRLSTLRFHIKKAASLTTDTSKKLRVMLLVNCVDPFYAESRLLSNLHRHVQHTQYGAEWFAIYDTDLADYVILKLGEGYTPYEPLWQ